MSPIAGERGGEGFCSAIQPDQINMAVLLCYLVKSDASATGHVKYYKVQEPTRPCITGYPVLLMKTN